MGYAARAYYMSSSIELENLSRAEATLQELIASIENAPHNVMLQHVVSAINRLLTCLDRD